MYRFQFTLRTLFATFATATILAWWWAPFSRTDFPDMWVHNNRGYFPEIERYTSQEDCIAGGGGGVAMDWSEFDLLEGPAPEMRHG